MCKYCDGSEWTKSGQLDDKPSVLINGNVLEISCFPASIHGGTELIQRFETIDFCPKCGTPLGEVKALTVEQLRQLDGDKISIHYIGRLKGFYHDEIAPYYGRLEQYIQNDNGKLAACELPLKFYGTTWLAFDREPKGGADYPRPARTIRTERH